MHKYLVTYLIADFSGSGADRLRTGLETIESSASLGEYALNLRFGLWITPDRVIMPGAILEVKEITK